MDVEGKTEKRQSFKLTQNRLENAVTFLLHADFTDRDWDRLEECYDEQLKRGYLHFDLDLRSLAYMNSQMLGLVVGMNTRIGAGGGYLRLIVAEGSMIHQLLTISKLHRLVTVQAV